MNGSVRLACLLILTAVASQGCASMAPAGPLARTDAGVVEMDWRTGRNLELAEHTFRRDRSGHLVVAVRLINLSDEPYYACLCVDFRDGVGAYERCAHQNDTEKLPPGGTSMEWTSYKDSAASYVVSIRSARFWQW
jgi:hypothetical protein